MLHDNQAAPAPIAEAWIGDEDRATILEAAACMRDYDPVTEAERFITEAQIHSAALTSSLSRAMLSFRRHGNPVGGMIVHDVPTGEVPPTPERADTALGTRLTAAAAMSIIASRLGDQYGFKPELGGNIIQDVLPVVGAETSQQSIGSEVRLEDHTEVAFSEFRCDYVGLMCVRGDHDKVAGTTLASIERILPLLDAETIRVLKEPRFATSIDESFLVGGFGEQMWIGPIPVLTGRVERPRVRVDFALTTGLDDEAQAALEKFRDVEMEVAIPFVLEAGDLLFVDNHRALHGRTWFKARADGLDRWLLRTFISKDLARSEHVRPGDGRIVDSDCSDVPTLRESEIKIHRVKHLMPG